MNNYNYMLYKLMIILVFVSVSAVYGQEIIDDTTGAGAGRHLRGNPWAVQKHRKLLPPSCFPWNACEVRYGHTGEGSCRGYHACYLSFMNVGDGSCVDEASASNPNLPMSFIIGVCEMIDAESIGNNSCVGSHACSENKGRKIGHNSCRGDFACCGNVMERGDNECNDGSCCVQDAGMGVCQCHYFKEAVESTEVVDSGGIWNPNPGTQSGGVIPERYGEIFVDYDEESSDDE